LASGLFGLVMLCASGCATQGEGPLDKALNWMGLRQPDAVQQARSAQAMAANTARPRQVDLRLHAGQVLNTDNTGRSLAVVARVYKLRSATGFLQLPHDSFLQERPDADSPLAKDVVGVQEWVLTPGQQLESIVNLSPEVSHLAVVALFRSPAPQRWRFVFESVAASASGVTLGLHGCAISVGTGEALNAPVELRRVAGVHCG
jgi:type VI secretion system protein VasD